MHAHNAQSYMEKPVCDTLAAPSWEVLPQSVSGYRPELAPSDLHMFGTMGHALAEHTFSSSIDAKK